MLLLFAVLLGFIPILLALFLLLKVYITIHYSFEDNKQQIQVSIALSRFRIINKSIPLNKVEDYPFINNVDDMLDSSEVDSYIATFRKIMEALHSILKNTKLHQLNWSTMIGTGEASSTGVVSGAIWAIKGSIIGYFAEKFILMCNPDIQVNPKFQQEYFQTNLDCMVSIRIGKAIQAFIKVNRLFK
ncbi:DUF2953 domain-containing protein [Oceanobacillus salinisoli]|uniref:DUF2953 domain-containing protein n=1 Tax=Oceanobacillus salinisoli TaxID=2678611 RepID=UPI0012E22EE6|nr:DUF2953 domain-containing protein [Oceanobacillus salinisoli]